MTDLILGVIILVLIGAFGWYIREQERVKSKLINAILAEDSNEYLKRNIADRVEPEKPKKELPPEYVPAPDLTDEEFDNHIEEINNG